MRALGPRALLPRRATTAAARVAHRLAMDHPRGGREARGARHRADARDVRADDRGLRARLLALVLPDPARAACPRSMIGADPAAYLRVKMGQGRAGWQPFAPEALAEYERCFTPEIDPRELRGLPRRGRHRPRARPRRPRGAAARCAAPLLALWGAHGVIEKCFKPLDEWRRVADDVRGRALPAGHYLPEEVPDARGRRVREILR